MRVHLGFRVAWAESEIVHGYEIASLNVVHLQIAPSGAGWFHHQLQLQNRPRDKDVSALLYHRETSDGYASGKSLHSFH